MKSLYELAQLNHKNRAMLEVLIPEEPNSPMRKLANIVFSEKEISDQECMIKIYGKRNITAFSRLKSRLRDILHVLLVNQINILDDPEVISNLVLENIRSSLIGRILVLKRAQEIGIELLEKTISKSIKYNLTENTVVQARQLVNGYSSYKVNKYKFSKYSEIQKKYLHIYEWEVKAENYFFDLQRHTIQSLANPSNELVAKAEKYVHELDYVKDVKTPFFVYNKYRILAVYYEYTKDYNALLKISESAIKDYSSPQYKSPVIVSNIYVRKIWALIQSGQTKEAIQFGKNVMNKLYPGSNPWYRIGLYTLKALLYTGNYKQGLDLLINLLNHPKFQKLEYYYVELFNTTLGYLHLLVESGLAGNTKELQKKIPEFKLGKFLNTTPVFSKDKRGINVSILLMHIAFLLQRKDYNAIIDRTDSLNQYAYRYLRRDDSFRSNCMIKMVIQMTKADFHPVRTERYTADLRRQLSTVNLAGSGENIEIEIIPFEVLWEIMVKSL